MFSASGSCQKLVMTPIAADESGHRLFKSEKTLTGSPFSPGRPSLPATPWRHKRGSQLFYSTTSVLPFV